MDNRLMISFIVVKNRMNKCELLTVSLLGPNSFCIFSFRGNATNRSKMMKPALHLAVTFSILKNHNISYC